jgi:hypothetical protein
MKGLCATAHRPLMLPINTSGEWRGRDGPIQVGRTPTNDEARAIGA